MTEEFSYLTAFIVGLMSGVHCVGMCGGIVSALSMSVNQTIKSSSRGYFQILLAYNSGRLFSYVMAGVIMGGLGWLVASWSSIKDAQSVLQLVAALMMILLGMYISGWWTVLSHVERLGLFLWKYLEPSGRKFIPVQTVRQALMFGLFWGWLPCGLVYSVLIWAIASGDWIEGGLLMLFFGLGTIPNLLAMGVFASQMRDWIAKAWVRQLAGGVIICFGFWASYLFFVS